MKAFIIDRYKPSDGGRIADVPEPVPADGQVLVQIHAAGVNLLDSKIRSGEFKFILPYRMPLILGNDVAGEVVRVGPGVRRFNVGDEVYAESGRAKGKVVVTTRCHAPPLDPKPCATAANQRWLSIRTTSRDLDVRRTRVRECEIGRSGSGRPCHVADAPTTTLRALATGRDPLLPRSGARVRAPPVGLDERQVGDDLCNANVAQSTSR